MKLVVQACPGCGQLLRFDRKSPGAKVSCSSCSEPFILEGRFEDFLLKGEFVRRFDSWFCPGEIASSGQPVMLQFLPNVLFTEESLQNWVLGQIQLITQVSHPYLVPLVDYRLLLGECCIAWGTSSTTSLERLFTSGRRLAEAQVLEMLVHLVEALESLEAAGLCHGMITPGFVLLDSSSQPQLMGYGFPYGLPVETLTASALDSTYLAPERFSGEMETTSDIYGLGELTYQALVGQAPHRVVGAFSMTAICKSKARTLWVPEMMPPVSPGAANLVSRMTAPNPGDRPASYVELKNEIIAVKMGGGATGTPRPKSAGPMPKQAPATLSTPVIAAGVAATLLVLGVLGWFFTRKPAPEPAPQPTTVAEAPATPEPAPAEQATTAVTPAPTPEPSSSPASSKSPTTTVAVVPSVGAPPVAVKDPRVELLSADSKRTYYFAKLAPNMQAFSDRDFALSEFPSNLEGALALVTANDDKFSTNPKHVSFRLAEDAEVYVFYSASGNDTAVPYPGFQSWLADWTQTEEPVKIGRFRPNLGRKKLFPAGSVVELGGNGLGVKNPHLHYLVFIRFTKT